MKFCLKCKQDKDQSEFSKNRSCKDGLQDWCKSCCSEEHKAYLKTEDGKEAQKKGNKRYLQTEAGKAANRRKVSPEKIKAHKAVAYALKTGKLRKRPCEICTNPKVRAFYPDYCKPLEVIWLCRGCLRKCKNPSPTTGPVLVR